MDLNSVNKFSLNTKDFMVLNSVSKSSLDTRDLWSK